MVRGEYRHTRSPFSLSDLLHSSLTMKMSQRACEDRESDKDFCRKVAQLSPIHDPEKSFAIRDLL